MAWRKWMVRGVVFSILGGLACAAWVYHRWTNSAAVRQHVMAKLEQMFPGAVVSLDSAHLQLLGGIKLHELRLTRRDDPERTELLYVPSAVLYHDKEKLLDGILSVRKVELNRPRVRLIRHRGGGWNIDGLAAPGEEHKAMPTLVVHQGALLLEDRLGDGLPAVEIANVNLTLINDPLPALAFEGSAASDAMGDVQLRGTWNRSLREANIALQAQGVPLGPALVRRLAAAFPSAPLCDTVVCGKADLTAEITFKPAAPQSFVYTATCKLFKTRVQHPQLCLPLEDVDATMHVSNGQLRLEQLSARAGTATLTARGSAFLPNPERDFEGSLDVKNLNLCRELFEHLPDKLKPLEVVFKPLGPADLRIDCARQDGKWACLAGGAPSRVILSPRNLSVLFKNFKYPLERVSGSVDLDLLTQLVTVDATGFAGPQPVSIKGTWRGQGKDVECRFDIAANDVPVDAQLLNAIPSEPMKKLAHSFHPVGKADLRAHIRHAPGDDRFYQEYHAALHELSVLWDDFPYPVEEISGQLDIYPHAWDLRDFRGRHHGGEIVIHGRSKLAADGSKGLVLEMTGRNIAVDADLRAALTPTPLAGLAKAWDTFVPSGRMSISAKIERPGAPAGKPEAGKSDRDGWKKLDIVVTGGGCTLKPVFLPYAMDQVRGGWFHYHDGRLAFGDVTASHGPTALSIEKGTVDLHGGGYYAKLHNVQAVGLYPDDEFVKALPASLERGLTSVRLRDPVNLSTHLVVTQAAEPGSPTTVWWDGQVRLEKAELTTGLDWRDLSATLACRGLYQGRRLKELSGNFQIDDGTLLRQPFHDVHGAFYLNEALPDVLNLKVTAPFFGGDLSGPIRIDFRPPLHYELNLTLSQMNLQEFGRHNLGPQTHLQGQAMGRLHLTGQANDPEALEGHGRIDIPAGRLYNLPLLLDLIKFLGLRWPDRTFFEEGKAVFAIHGRRARMEHLELIGNAVSFYGQGDFNLNGSDLKLDFYPTWGRVQQLMPPVLRSIPAEIGRNMLKIEMRGKVGSNPDDLKFTKKPVPVLLEPILQMRDRIFNEPEIGRTSEKR